MYYIRWICIYAVYCIVYERLYIGCMYRALYPYLNVNEYSHSSYPLFFIDTIYNSEAE